MPWVACLGVPGEDRGDGGIATQEVPDLGKAELSGPTGPFPVFWGSGERKSYAGGS